MLVQLRVAQQLLLHQWLLQLLLLQLLLLLLLFQLSLFFSRNFTYVHIIHVCSLFHKGPPLNFWQIPETKNIKGGTLIKCLISMLSNLPETFAQSICFLIIWFEHTQIFMYSQNYFGILKSQISLHRLAHLSIPKLF